MAREVIPGLSLCDDHLLAVRTADGAKIFDPLREAVVYYISWRGVNEVKIGTTSNLRLRVGALSTQHSPAKVLAAEPGSYYLERKRHRQFASLALGNERFRWAPALSEHIQEVRDRTGWTPSNSRDGLRSGR